MSIEIAYTLVGRWTTMLLLPLTMAACTGSPGDRAAQSGADEAASTGDAAGLTVMTFNIRYNNPDDGRHAWPNRRDRVAELIRFYQPDVLGVQEALQGQMEDLEARLPDYEWFGRGRQADSDGGEFSAVFYRPDRLELVENETFWLSPTPDEPASVGWDAALPRIVTWGRLTDRRTGRTFYHFNTHFDHRGDTARARSAELLVRRIEARDQNLPVVVTGDFNFTPDEIPYQTLRNVLDDAIQSTELHFGPEGTSPSGFEVTRDSLSRIDYIWTTPDIAVRRSATLTNHVHGDYPSDHLPVIAVIELPAGGSR